MRTGFKTRHVVFALVAVGMLALSTPSGAASATNHNTGTQHQGTALTPVGPPVFQVTGVNTCGCASDDISLAGTYANIPSGAVEHTLVIVAGVVYMDQVGSFLSGSGGFNWFLFSDNSGGTATGTWPLPSGQPIQVIVTVDQPLGTILTGWQVTLDGCGSCTIINSQENASASVPTTTFFGLAALAALLLVAGVFVILRLRA